MNEIYLGEDTRKHIHVCVNKVLFLNCLEVCKPLSQKHTHVVYFNQLLGAARTWKLVKTLFSAVFNLFCLFQTFFSDFMAEINKKHLKKNQKIIFFAYSSKLVDMQKLVDSLRGPLEIVFFQLIFNVFCLFSTDFGLFPLFMLKTAEKKCFDQLSGARSTQKLVEKHNTNASYFVDTGVTLRRTTTQRHSLISY